ncbi:MAG: hypothetical protein ABMA64_27670 [Myxococcota bacterium]
MAPERASSGASAVDAVVFSAPARCCTYHPRLPNFSVGRILAAGGVGAERVRAQLLLPDTAHPVGLVPPGRWRKAWSGRAHDAFGRDPSLNCPFWVDGTPLACSIHREREAVCRTWHCRLSGGLRAQAAWNAAFQALAKVEKALAEWCVKELDPDTFAADVAGFYLRSAERVAGATDAELAALRTPGLTALLEQVALRVGERDGPMPERLQPRIREWWRSGDTLALSSFSSLDREEVPGWIFELLSRLDGERTWVTAIADTAAAGFPADEALVRRLWRRGLLGPPEEAEIGGMRVSVSFVPAD